MRRGRSLRVNVSRQALDSIQRAAEQAHPRETGGVLLGWWQDPAVWVELAVEVPDPDATGNGWTRHEETAQQALDDAVRGAEHPWLGYVGDWHSHPAACNASRNDVTAIRRASRQYDKPLVLLVHRVDGTIDSRAARAGRTRAIAFSYEETNA